MPAKKSVTKSVVSKSVKKVAPKAAKKVGGKAKGAMACCSGVQASAPEDKCFWINNGPVVGDLAALREALLTMTDEQYAYHTKRAGNDFAKWIDEVLGHRTCAEKLGRAKTRATAIRAIATCVRG